MGLAAIDWVILFLYVGFMVGIGLVLSRRASRSIGESSDLTATRLGDRYAPTASSPPGGPPARITSSTDDASETSA